MKEKCISQTTNDKLKNVGITLFFYFTFSNKIFEIFFIKSFLFFFEK